MYVYTFVRVLVPTNFVLMSCANVGGFCRFIFTQNFVFFSNIFLQSFKLIFHHCYLLLLLFFNVLLVLDYFFITLLFTFSVSISKFSFLRSTYCSLSFPFSSKTSSETLSEIRAGADRRCFPSVRTPVLQNRTQLPV